MIDPTLTSFKSHGNVAMSAHYVIFPCLRLLLFVLHSNFLSLAMFWYFNSWRSMVCQSLLIYSVTMMESFMGFRFFAPTSNVSLILANRVPYFACLLSALKSNFKDSSNMSPSGPSKIMHVLLPTRLDDPSTESIQLPSSPFSSHFFKWLVSEDSFKSHIFLSD